MVSTDTMIKNFKPTQAVCQAKYLKYFAPVALSVKRVWFRFDGYILTTRQVHIRICPYDDERKAYHTGSPGNQPIRSSHLWTTVTGSEMIQFAK